jgi:large subunit ribosomal protein L25
MGDKFVLEASKRDVIGKKVRQLRTKGQIPAIVYGPKQNPIAITVDWTKLRPTLQQAGGNKLVEIQVDKETYPTLIRRVDRHPVRGSVLHVDFYAVDLTRTVISTVPLVIINEDKSRAKLSGAEIVHEALNVEVETLPTDIPDHIELDVSSLAKIGQTLHISDLPQLPGVAYASDPDMVLVRASLVREIAELEEGAEGTQAEPELVRKQKEEVIED